MKTKSPCSFDGKPVGTSTIAVSPQQAGCTMGLDVIERADAARRERNRALRAAIRGVQQERRAIDTPEALRKRRFQHARRLSRVKQWRALLAQGKSIRDLASRKFSAEHVLAEVQWFGSRAFVESKKFQRPEGGR